MSAGNYQEYTSKGLLLYTAYARATGPTSNQCAPRSTSAARPRALAVLGCSMEQVRGADWCRPRCTRSGQTWPYSWPHFLAPFRGMLVIPRE